LKQLSENTNDLVKCYEKYSSTAAIITPEVLDAGAKLAVAGVTLLDARKVYENIEQQSKLAFNAAEKYIRDNRKDLDDHANDLNRSLFGVNLGQVDLGKTVDRLKNIALGNNPIQYLSNKARAAIDLAGDYAELAQKAMVAAKKAFLNQDKLKIACREKTNDALPLAAFAKAKLEAAKAKRNNSQVFAKLVPLSQVAFKLEEIMPGRKINRALKNR